MKKNIILITILLVISIISIVLVYNDYSLYKGAILKVKSIETTSEKMEDSDEVHYHKVITGVIMNTSYKGRTLSIEHDESASYVYDERITNSSELFVDLSKDGSNILSISGIKRDKYIVILLVLFIDFIIIVGKLRGLKIILSLLINIIISLGALYLYVNYFSNINILFIFIPLSIIYIISSILLTNKLSKKTTSIIISSIISLLASFFLAYILLLIYRNKIPFWFMNYIEAVKDYENIFYVNILLSSLGAIMDIATSISSLTQELIDKDKNISISSLSKSGRIMSKDIIGTMVNVMFFTIFASIIPFSVLVVRNGIPLSSVLSTVGELEMVRVLTSSIGIVLAIPISLYISIYILRRKEANK